MEPALQRLAIPSKVNSLNKEYKAIMNLTLLRTKRPAGVTAKSKGKP